MLCGSYKNTTVFYDLTKNRLQSVLSQVPGVGQVAIVGGVEREIKVNLNRERLEAYNLPASLVLGKIRAANLDFPTGKVKNDENSLLIRLAGKFTSVDQLSNTIISSNNGQNIYLRDVAKVVNLLKEKSTINI